MEWLDGDLMQLRTGYNKINPMLTIKGTTNAADLCMMKTKNVKNKTSSYNHHFNAIRIDRLAHEKTE